MQTFLPFPDFAASAATLDDLRLGKQRVEALQVLRAITAPAPTSLPRTYRHPARRRNWLRQVCSRPGSATNEYTAVTALFHCPTGIEPALARSAAATS